MTKEEIKTMTKEERKRQLEWSDPYEFGTVYAEYLLEENQQLKEQLEASERARKEAIKYINTTEYSGIVGLNNNGIKEFWFMKDLLEILDNKGE